MAKLLLPPTDQEQLAMHMHEEGLFGVAERPEDYITLKSKRRSPHYFDVRPGLSNPKTRRMVGDTMARLMLWKTDAADFEDLKAFYEHVVGSPEAMTSYAERIADTAEMSLLQPRVNLTKVSGNRAPILGRANPGDRVAAFDDVITDGVTKIETISSLGAAGLTVEDYFVVLDREEGGASDVFAATELNITPALGLASTVKILRANNAINRTQFDNVAEYIGQYGDPHAVAELAA